MTAENAEHCQVAQEAKYLERAKALEEKSAPEYTSLAFG